MIHDALRLNKSVCLARHFHRLKKVDIESSQRKVFVDIWPVGDSDNSVYYRSRLTNESNVRNERPS
jgi:hypothetical protein